MHAGMNGKPAGIRPGWPMHPGSPGPTDLMVIGPEPAHGRPCLPGLSAWAARVGCLTTSCRATLGIAAVVHVAHLFLALGWLAQPGCCGWAIQALRSGGTWRHEHGQKRPGSATSPTASSPTRSTPRWRCLPGFPAPVLRPGAGRLTPAWSRPRPRLYRSDCSDLGSMALAAGSYRWPAGTKPRLGPWLDRLCGVLFIGPALRIGGGMNTGPASGR